MNDIRKIALRPFRLYVDFAGRSARAEFWIFILIIVVALKLTSLATYGVLHLAGFDDQHQERFNIHFELGDSSANHNPDNRTGVDDMTFEFHRHDGVDGYHLHVGLSGSRHLAAGERDDLGRDYKSHDYGKLHSRRMHWYQTPSRRVEDRVVGLVMLLLAVPLFATGARRLHDSGKSGWWQLLALIPVAGWIVLLIFFLIPGDETANKFGPPPNSGEPVNTH